MTAGCRRIDEHRFRRYEYRRANSSELSIGKVNRRPPIESADEQLPAAPQRTLSDSTCPPWCGACTKEGVIAEHVLVESAAESGKARKS